MVHKIFLHFLNFILFIFFWGGGGLVHSECPVTTHVSYSASFVPISLFFRHQFINHYNCSCDHSHLCWYALYLQIWRQLIRLLWINCKSTNVWLVLVLFLFCFCFVFFMYCPWELDCVFCGSVLVPYCIFFFWKFQLYNVAQKRFRSCDICFSWACFKWWSIWRLIKKSVPVNKYSVVFFYENSFTRYEIPVVWSVVVR